jgi:hypothetical protein
MMVTFPIHRKGRRRWADMDDILKAGEEWNRTRPLGEPAIPY